MVIVPQYIPDIIAEVVSRVSERTEAIPDVGFKTFFDWGRYADVTKNLKQKADAMTEEDRKSYPLIWLVCDFDEIMMPLPQEYAKMKLHLIIGTVTQPNYTMRERRDISFLPILYPIYSILLDELSKTKAFGYPGFNDFRGHRKTDRAYWGGNENYVDSVANLWSNFIDAIQIRDLPIQVKAIC